MTKQALEMVNRLLTQLWPEDMYTMHVYNEQAMYGKAILFYICLVSSPQLDTALDVGWYHVFWSW